MLKLLMIVSLVLGFAATALSQAHCPTFSLTGPAGIWMPGDEVSFVLSGDGPLPYDVRYEWTFKGGNISRGQGTKAIKVQISKEWSYTIIATVKIHGLAPDCASELSESAFFCTPAGPIQIDEYSVPIGDIDLDRLTLAADEQRYNPSDQLYIIEYFSPDATELQIAEKIRKTKEHLTAANGLRPQTVTIITAEADEPLTKIYRVRPGSENPIP